MVDERPAIDPTLCADDLSTKAGRTEPPAGDLDARWLGRFAVLRKLGEGGMGTVYAAYDERLERRVALKLLHAGDRERLEREALALARLSHPHVVQIYEVGEFEGRTFVAMEYVEGPTLAAWLSAPCEASAILDVFIQAGRGLAAAHERGLVHRDFKPGNVIVGADGRVRVLDFGLVRADGKQAEDEARVVAAAGALPADLLTNDLTRTGMLLGTPAYMSPEQHMGVPVDARSDQFSFCAALFEALHGQRAFAGETLAELGGNVITGELRPAPPRADVSPAVEAAIRRGLLPDPAARWPSMEELLEELVRERKPTGALDNPRIRALLTGLVVFVGVTVLLGLGSQAPTTPSMVGFSLALAAVTLAGLPFLRRRYRRPEQRTLLHFGVVMILASAMSRIVFWRTGQPVETLIVGETLVFATGFAVAAACLNRPKVAAAAVMLLGALVVVLELGLSVQLIPLAWVAAVPVSLRGLRREA